MGIAVRTFFDDDVAGNDEETRKQRIQRLAEFPDTYVPHAEALSDDFRTCWDFVDALNKGVQTLDTKEVSAADKASWAKAQDYMDARPFWNP